MQTQSHPVPETLIRAPQPTRRHPVGARWRPLLLATVMGVALAQPSAHAATATAVVAVSATVLSVCTIAATPLVFGNYTSVQLDATATVTVVCTATSAYDVGLNAGTATGATVSNRKMANGTSLLGYGLFRDAARTSNWGNTVGTDTVSGSGTGLPQAVTVYGRIAAGQFVTPGAYADVVTATITY